MLLWPQGLTSQYNSLFIMHNVLHILLLIVLHNVLRSTASRPDRVRQAFVFEQLTPAAAHALASKLDAAVADPCAERSAAARRSAPD